MNTTAREALIAEAIGDVAQLLDRAETLQSEMAELRQSFVNAQSQFSSALCAFETQLSSLTEKAKVQAVRHILTRTDEAVRRSTEAQTRAMGDAALVLFKSEIEPALQRLAARLERLMQRTNRPWRDWLTHTAAAVAASALTWCLAAWMWAR